MPLTPCPECKLPISSDALSCPRCGKPVFAAQAGLPQRMAPAAGLGVGGVALGLVLGALGLGWIQSREPPRLTLAELYASYRRDPKAADAQFKGKRLIVDAVVSDIDGSRDDRSLDLHPPRPERTAARADMRYLGGDRDDGIEEDMAVRLLCLVGGWVDGAPALHDCELLR